MPAEIDLLSIDRGTVTAPAGCGKTHLIADALTRHSEPKPILVLTHTNAGVAALRSRLDRFGVPARRYRLSTIDGWSMRLARTFPARSGIDPAALNLTNGRDYASISDAAGRLLEAGHISDVLAATYDRMIVDEYQDCSRRQHVIVYHAARSLRTVLLGDPMQAIFDFGDSLADWHGEVCAHFPLVGHMNTPHRWIQAGEEAFGRWLFQIRDQLAAGQAINLQSAPRNVTWMQLQGNADDHRVRLNAGRINAGPDAKILIIANSRDRNRQRAYAAQIPGAVTVENADMADLVTFGNGLDLASPHALSHVVHFAQSTMTNVGAQDLLDRVASLTNGWARRDASEAEAEALRFVRSPS